MPGIVKVRVLEGKNLPVMDRSADTTDAYVELKLGNLTHKTEVCRKSLNPQWNSEWYRFEMDDADLQDEPLQVRLMDHDTYSANDLIGKVYFNLNPLMLNTSVEARSNMMKAGLSLSPSSSCISGWFPVYDTIHGLRGEIHVIIKLELFSDFNKFRQSSCGIHVFCSSIIPYGYYTEKIFGFVEELVVEDDPEYQWIEKIRTPRASNEARQAMFYKMSGELQRKIGLKVIELGGNAVIGYRQCFDLEGETGGVVVRGIGTAVKIHKNENQESNIKRISNNNECTLPNIIISSPYTKSFDMTSLRSVNSSEYTSDAGSDSVSLWSFISGTSGGSRRTYTERKRRSPFFRTGNKFLSVASKIRKKFGRRQPSRKFSIIEEHKWRNDDWDDRVREWVPSLEEAEGQRVYDARQTEAETQQLAIGFEEEFKENTRSGTDDKKMVVIVEGAKQGDENKKQIEHYVEEPDTDSLDDLFLQNPVQHAEHQLGLEYHCESDDEMLRNVERCIIPDVTLYQNSGTPVKMKERMALDEIRETVDSCTAFCDDSTKEPEIERVVMKKIITKTERNVDVEENLGIQHQFRADTKTKLIRCSSVDIHESVGDSTSNKHSRPIDSMDSPELEIEEKKMKFTANDIDFSLGLIDWKKASNPHKDEKKELEGSNFQIQDQLRIDVDRSYSDYSSVSTGTSAVTVKDIHEFDQDWNSVSCLTSRPNVSEMDSVIRDKIMTERKAYSEMSLNAISDTRVSKKSSSVSNATQIESGIKNVKSDFGDFNVGRYYESKRAKPEMQANFSKSMDVLNHVRSSTPKIADMISIINDEKIGSALTLKTELEPNRSVTPPISEMTAVPADLNTESPAPVKVEASKKVCFDGEFLRKLFRADTLNYKPVTECAAFRKILNEKERSLSRCSERLDDSNQSVIDDLRSTKESSIVSSDVNNCSSLDYDPSLSESNNSNNSNNSFDSINPPTNVFSNELQTDNNILREALTSSRLLMHANHDRKISESAEKVLEDDMTSLKLENVPENALKKRSSLPDNGIFVSKMGSRVDNIQPDELDPTTSKTSSTELRGRNAIHKDNFDMMEYPFLTLSMYPDNFITHVGGTVSTRSVKLLGRISNIEEPETRDAWWTELRIEIKSHMRALACNAVLNYVETTSIYDEVCVLSATGTAAVVKIHDKSYSTNETQKGSQPVSSEMQAQESNYDENCSIFHIPYRKSSLPFPVKIKTCGVCRKGFVTDMLFLTIEPWENMSAIGQGAFIHTFVYRLKRDCKNELNAREVSDGLPFLEYELNRQLVNKMRIKGMNALFGLNVQVAVGEKMISAYATATAVLLSALPPPPEPTLVFVGRHLPEINYSRKKIAESSKLLDETIKKNKLYYQLTTTQSSETQSTTAHTNVDSLNEQHSDLDYYAGSKQTYAIEIDEEDDLDLLNQLIDPNPPQGFLVSATEKILMGSLPYVIKKNIQHFTLVYRFRIPNSTPQDNFNKLFYRMVQGLYVKIHNRIPCALNKVSFKMDIPEPDELQIRIEGMALALKETEKSTDSGSVSCSSFSENDDFMINIDDKEFELVDSSSTFTPRKVVSSKKNFSNTEIFVTSLTYVPGAVINYYLGSLNFFLIRESSMVKETGGVNNFVNNFLSDVTLIVKSHAAGIGGNAIVGFFVNECVLVTHSYKNQGQCLINVGGDVVRYTLIDPKTSK